MSSKERKEALEKIREQYKNEYEKTMDTLIGIRDGIGAKSIKCEHCDKSFLVDITKDNDRIKAMHEMITMQGWRVKESAKPSGKAKEEIPELTKPQQKDQDELYRELFKI